nr:MAG TPA: hypothetical protein [Caudoviricetes sp.]
MAKPKYRDIKIQRNGKFNTNGTVHNTIEEAFAYWDRKLPNDTTTTLIFPDNIHQKTGLVYDIKIACFSLEFAKQCLE